MIVARRTTIVGNPKKRKKRPSINRPKKSFSVKHRSRNKKRSNKGNPAYLMLLGPANPKRSRTVAKKKKKNRAAGSHHHRSVARSQNTTHRRSISKAQVKAFMKEHGMGRPKSKSRKAGNPFAKSISLSRPSDLVTAGAGVLVGVFGVKTGMGFVPSNITSNPMLATVAALAVAAAEWWALSFVSPEFGAAVGLGGIAEAASIALSGYGFPQLSLSGTGDFVPGKFVVPQNPVLDAATGYPKTMTMAPAAYPRAYAAAG